MSGFSLPAADVKPQNNDQTDETDETTFGGERVDDYEDYWKAISMVRFEQKACKTLGVAKVKDAGKSPYADHYAHFAGIAYGEGNTFADRENPAGLHGKCADLDGSLPKYKEEFETPEGDFEVITAENCEEYGIDSDHFGEDEDPIFVPSDYEPPAEVWYETVANEETVTEVLQGISGIGEARAEEAYKALSDAGLLAEEE